MALDFVNLRLHSEYSITCGLATIKELVNKAKQENLDCIGLTDKENLSSILKFFNECKSNKIHNISGCEIFLELNKNEIIPLTFLIKSFKGYHQLSYLITQGEEYKKNKDDKLIIKKEWLKKYGVDELIVLNNGWQSKLNEILKNKNQNSFNLAVKHILELKEIFKDNLYIEIQRLLEKEKCQNKEKFLSAYQEQEKIINQILDISKEHKVNCVITHPVYFLNKQDWIAYKIRNCIALKDNFDFNSLNNPSVFDIQEQETYFKSNDEIFEIYQDLIEKPQIIKAFENTRLIANQCQLDIKNQKLENQENNQKNLTISDLIGKNFLPQIQLKDLKVEDYFQQQSILGLQERFKELENIDKNLYLERLNTEIEIIKKMGFCSYFLIVSDFIQWAKNNNIPVGPGRGSGAGSLVAYALKITEIDPIAYSLLFERFLNPERVSMPDFDIDFCQEGRDRVINYVKNKYGNEYVTQIATFGTLTTKNLIKDIARVLNIEYKFSDELSKLVPSKNNVPESLENTLQLPEFRNFYEEWYNSNNNKNKTVSFDFFFDIAKKLENKVKNVGKHAGGVVIAPNVLLDQKNDLGMSFFCPIYQLEKNNIVTQLDKNDVEQIGLVKFDFLGLKNLTIINNTLKNIEKNRLKIEKELDKNSISDNKYEKFKYIIQNFNTEKVFSHLCLSINKENYDKDDILNANLELEREALKDIFEKNNLLGVFQLENPNLKKFVDRFKIFNFDDIVALNALNRPGPLGSGMTEQYIQRKNNPETKWDCFHPDLEPCLKNTYGVIVYQEQVMQISQIIGGYTLGQADILRRAMGKKKPEEMAKQRSIFIEGAKKRGYGDYLIEVSVKDEETNQEIIKKVPLAEHLFDLMQNFAEYGFNKSHTVAYSKISLQTAWLKALFPAEYFSATISVSLNDEKDIEKYLKELQRLNIKVDFPNENHINKDLFYNLEPVIELNNNQNIQNKVIFGLGGLKKISQDAVEQLNQIKNSQNTFINFKDFLFNCYFTPNNEFANYKNISKDVLENLIKIGLFDVFDNDKLQEHRALLLNNLPFLIDKIKDFKKNNEIKNKPIQNTNQNSLFGLDLDTNLNNKNNLSEKIKNFREEFLNIKYLNFSYTNKEEEIQRWVPYEINKNERDVLGFFQNGSEFEFYSKFIKNLLKEFPISKKENEIENLTNNLFNSLNYKYVSIKNFKTVPISYFEKHKDTVRNINDKYRKVVLIGQINKKPSLSKSQNLCINIKDSSNEDINIYIKDEFFISNHKNLNLKSRLVEGNIIVVDCFIGLNKKNETDDNYIGFVNNIYDFVDLCNNTTLKNIDLNEDIILDENQCVCNNGILNYSKKKINPNQNINQNLNNYTSENQNNTNKNINISNNNINTENVNINDNISNINKNINNTNINANIVNKENIDIANENISDVNINNKENIDNKILVSDDEKWKVIENLSYRIWVKKEIIDNKEIFEKFKKVNIDLNDKKFANELILKDPFFYKLVLFHNDENMDFLALSLMPSNINHLYGEKNYSKFFDKENFYDNFYNKYKIFDIKEYKKNLYSWVYENIKNIPKYEIFSENRIDKKIIKNLSIEEIEYLTNKINENHINSQKIRIHSVLINNLYYAEYPKALFNILNNENYSQYKKEFANDINIDLDENLKKNYYEYLLKNSSFRYKLSNDNFLKVLSKSDLEKFSILNYEQFYSLLSFTQNIINDIIINDIKKQDPSYNKLTFFKELEKNKQLNLNYFRKLNFYSNEILNKYLSKYKEVYIKNDLNKRANQDLYKEKYLIHKNNSQIKIFLDDENFINNMIDIIYKANKRYEILENKNSEELLNEFLKLDDIYTNNNIFYKLNYENINELDIFVFQKKILNYFINNFYNNDDTLNNLKEKNILFSLYQFVEKEYDKNFAQNFFLIPLILADRYYINKLKNEKLKNNQKIDNEIDDLNQYILDNELSIKKYQNIIENSKDDGIIYRAEEYIDNLNEEIQNNKDKINSLEKSKENIENIFEPELTKNEEFLNLIKELNEDKFYNIDDLWIKLNTQKDFFILDNIDYIEKTPSNIYEELFKQDLINFKNFLNNDFVSTYNIYFKDNENIKLYFREKIKNIENSKNSNLEENVNSKLEQLISFLENPFKENDDNFKIQKLLSLMDVNSANKLYKENIQNITNNVKNENEIQEILGKYQGLPNKEIIKKVFLEINIDLNNADKENILNGFYQTYEKTDLHTVLNNLINLKNKNFKNNKKLQNLENNFINENLNNQNIEFIENSNNSINLNNLEKLNNFENLENSKNKTYVSANINTIKENDLENIILEFENLSKNFWVNEIKYNVNQLNNIGIDLDNEKIIKKLITFDPLIFAYAGENIKDNKNFIIENVLPYYVDNLLFISDNLKKDRKFLLEILKNYNNLDDFKAPIFNFVKLENNFYLFFTEILKENILLDHNLENDNFLKEMLNIDGKLFLCLKDYQNDKEFAQIALNNNGEIYNYLNDNLKNDTQLMKIAVKNNHLIFKDVIKNCEKNKININQKFILDFIQINHKVFQFLPFKLQINVDFIKLCMQKNIKIYEELNPNIKKNKEILGLLEIYQSKNIQENNSQIKNNPNLNNKNESTNNDDCVFF